MMSNAQQAPGSITIQPKVGLNIATLTDTEGSDPRFGVAVGAEMEYQISDMFSISGGALYSMQGVKGSGDGIDVTFKMDYINIPILANVYVVKGLALKAGIQPAFNVNSKISASQSGNSASVDFGDYTNTFDFSIPVGIFYEYKNFVLDARYNFGLTNVFKDEELETEEGTFDFGESDCKNSFFQITFGYKINL